MNQIFKIFLVMVIVLPFKAVVAQQEYRPVKLKLRKPVMVLKC
jgi:hypothetical protein